MDRAIVLSQDHRLGRLTALGTIKPVQLLEMGDESLLRLVGLVWTMSWRVT